MAGNQPLPDYIASLKGDIAAIPQARKTQLDEFAACILRASGPGPLRLNFICTHNSRRSHLTQIWAQTAAAHFGITDVETYSGGTEATAFAPRAVAALGRCGFEVEASDGQTDNPRYRVQGLPSQPVLTCYSKIYSDAPNPQSGYVAVMTCSSADQGCPVAFGAQDRFALTYEDPKLADGTPDEAMVYDARCRQIAAEAMAVWQLVATRRKG